MGTVDTVTGERHHTVVHTRKHAGDQVEEDTGTGAEWDLIAGSYNRPRGPGGTAPNRVL